MDIGGRDLYLSGLKDIACKTCGSLFTPNSGRHIFCSTDCKNQANNIKRVRKCKCGEILDTKANRCRKCSSEGMIKFRKDKIKSTGSKAVAYNYKYRSNNPEKYLLHNSRSRAKKCGFEHNLTEGDINIPDVCPVFGALLVLTVGGGRSDFSPSLDRIDSNLGYIKGNIQVLSWRANNLKSNGTLEEFKQLVRFMGNE
jgi:hypothetical protein